MKNYFTLFGIIAFVAVIGFSMSGCSNSKQFEGTWSGNGWELVVGSKTFVLTTNWPSSAKAQGTYTIKGNTITCIADENSSTREGPILIGTVDGIIMKTRDSIWGTGEFTLTKK
jgi:hypothetical protein